MRLRACYRLSGEAALQDYELLEALLMILLVRVLACCSASRDCRTKASALPRPHYVPCQK